MNTESENIIDLVCGSFSGRIAPIPHTFPVLNALRFVGDHEAWEVCSLFLARLLGKLDLEGGIHEIYCDTILCSEYTS